MSGKDSWNPEQYDKFKNERSQPFFDLIEMVEDKIEPRILDLGCGTGELTRALHDHFGAKYTLGIDRSQSMLEKAATHATPRLEFQPGRIEEFTEGGKYDLVFSNAALQWVRDHEAVFTKMKSTLGSEGQIAVQMPMNFDYATHTVAESLSLEEPYASALAKADLSLRSRAPKGPEWYAELLHRLGFERQKVLVRVYAHILHDRESVIEWVKGTLLTFYEGALPPELFQSFMAAYRKRLFDRLPEASPFFYPFKRLFIWGELK